MIIPAVAPAVIPALVDALNRRDWDAVLDSLPAEFEYDLTRTESPLRGVYGRAQMRRVIEEFIGSWESVRYEPHEYIEGEDCLVVPFTTHFRGRDGIEMQSDAVWVWTLGEGTVRRVTLFQDRGEALAAAGLV